MIADFHLHSHHSDGRLDPASLIDLVADAGVQVAALTDHDTTAGHKQAARRAQERAIHFIPGIEMTTFGHGRVVHVLALGIDGANANLGRANEIAAEVWDANQRAWVESLAREGVDVDFERDFPEHPVRLPVLVESLCGRQVDSGDPVRVHARFRSFFATLPAAAYARLPTPTQAATVVHDAGGLALLAHPVRLLEEGSLELLLEGCDGLEAMYGPYTDRQRAELRTVAEKHGKLYSCDSDYHGYFTTDYRRPSWPAPSQLLTQLGIS